MSPLFRWFVIPGVLCLLSALCLAVDIPVAVFCHGKHLPKFLREISDIAETFGHAAGVGFILITIAVIDPPRRIWLPACALGAFGGGLAADLIKVFVTRLRPRNVNLAESTVWETFVKSAIADSHSFPSAHTATATGLAVVLAEMYPQGRWLFFIYACLTGLHRIECSAHFPSDVCAGAAVGWIVGQAALAMRARLQRRDPPSQTAGF